MRLITTTVDVQVQCNKMQKFVYESKSIKAQKSKNKKSNRKIFKEVPSWYILSSTPPYATVGRVSMLHNRQTE